MKPNGNFKLSRPAKCMLATISDKTRRSAVRKLFIEGEMAKEVHARSKVKIKDTE